MAREGCACTTSSGRSLAPVTAQREVVHARYLASGILKFSGQAHHAHYCTCTGSSGHSLAPVTAERRSCMHDLVSPYPHLDLSGCPQFKQFRQLAIEPARTACTAACSAKSIQQHQQPSSNWQLPSAADPIIRREVIGFSGPACTLVMKGMCMVVSCSCH